MSARVVHDPQHRPLRAVAAQPPPAPGAAAAGEIDLADDPFAEKPGGRRSLDDPDELVARNSREGGVTATQLQIRVADSREDDPHESLVPPRNGPPSLSDSSQTPLEQERLHGGMLSDRHLWQPGRVLG